MSPSTRIAIALCIFHVMPYLFVPSESTWHLLPSALKPTQHQFLHPHDITVSFLPIPILRTLLAQNSVDWQKHASQHDLRLEWPGAWGDVGGASLTEVGHWQETHRPPGRRSSASTTPIPLTNEPSGTQQRPLRAISVDSASGRRYISGEFEQHCWALENWRFGKGILSIWPVLEQTIRTS